MPPRLLLDPLLCTTPEPTADPAALRAWLTALGAWLDEIDASPVDGFRHLLGCTVALQEARRFPDFRALRGLVQRAGVELNLEQLARRLQTFFLDEGRDLRGQLATRDALCDPEALVAPPLFLSRNAPCARDELRAGLLCLCCDEAAAPEAPRHQVVTRPSDGGQRSGAPSLDGARALRMEGRVALSDPERPPHELRHELPLLFCPEDLCDLLSTDEVIGLGPDAFVQRVRLLTRREGGDVLRPVLGASLWASLDESGIRHDVSAMNKLVRICAAVLRGQAARINSLDLRQFRESAAANAPQRKRASDGAAAWRLTITKYGVGWRLNFWHIPAREGQTESIEFALVQGKQAAEHIPP